MLKTKMWKWLLAVIACLSVYVLVFTPVSYQFAHVTAWVNTYKEKDVSIVSKYEPVSLQDTDEQALLAKFQSVTWERGGIDGDFSRGYVIEINVIQKIYIDVENGWCLLKDGIRTRSVLVSTEWVSDVVSILQKQNLPYISMEEMNW